MENTKIKKLLSQIIFLGRWLQAPLYFGLIVILGAYAYRFIENLINIIGNVDHLTDNEIMLGVLDLIDVVMLANLLIMVIIGGYETFVSHLNIKGEVDHPEWLDEINAGAMKAKLALALIGISSIHLLRTFIDPSKSTNISIMWQVVIHLTLVISMISIAWGNRLISETK